MAQTTITLSFHVCALVPDELPGPDALRSAVQDGLDADEWSSEMGDPWWLEAISTTLPQPQAVNAEVLDALEDCAHLLDLLHDDMGKHNCTIDCPDIGKRVNRARAAIAAASTA